MTGFPESQVSAQQIAAFAAESFPGSGNTCTEVGPGWAVAQRVARPDDIRPGGIISGPTLFGVADAALWYAGFTVNGIEAMALTSELSIRFLRPAIGQVAYGRAELHHSGRRSIIGSVRLWVDDDPDRVVAVAQGTYVRPR